MRRLKLLGVSLIVLGVLLVAGFLAVLFFAPQRTLQTILVVAGFGLIGSGRYVMGKGD